MRCGGPFVCGECSRDMVRSLAEDAEKRKPHVPEVHDSEA